MATANFKTMTDFPLIVSNTIREKICPECGCGCAEDADKCGDCGCDLTDVEPIVDDFLCEERMREMEKVAEELNGVQSFYNVSVESGYYTGIQFYVDEKYCDIDDMSNEESRDEFGICRSEMLRRYKVAGNTIRRGLYKAAKDLGLDTLVCTARFSNGEAWYTKVEPHKPLPSRVAAKAAIAAA
jgi:ribosomal protein L40E